MEKTFHQDNKWLLREAFMRKINQKINGTRRIPVRDNINNKFVEAYLSKLTVNKRLNRHDLI